MWARIFMSDLALSNYLEGEIALYDIDKESAIRNQRIGNIINNNSLTKSKWKYNVYDNLKDALSNSSVVVISILPGTFNEMNSDVHAPEKYGIYQSVGDTIGPGGVLRAMRTVPIYEDFAKKIKECCPKAWVINLTNPMLICVKTLYDVFPDIKAFGCCHEVFHTQDLLCDILKEEKGISNITRNDITYDVSGINHFTWFTSAKYHDIEILDLLDTFFAKHVNGYYEHGNEDQYLSDPFAYNNLVKYDLYKRHHILPCAGDRHLVEFLSFKDYPYLNSKNEVKKWKFALTPVALRIKQQQEKIEESILLSQGKKDYELKKSNEEVVELIECLLGKSKKISNVNYPNLGQVPYLNYKEIVESNCVFSNDTIKPIISNNVNESVKKLIDKNLDCINMCYEGIKNRDLIKIYKAFKNQPLCDKLSSKESKLLFIEMVENTSNYLKDYYDLSNINEKILKED